MHFHVHFHTARHKGSISAEHGLGFKKAQYIYHSKSREVVQWMKHVKKLFDPNVWQCRRVLCECGQYMSMVSPSLRVF